MKKIKFLMCLTLTCAMPDLLQAEPSDAWEKVGADPLNSAAIVYINRERVSRIEGGWILAPAFTVYDSIIAGIDIPDGAGGTYYDQDFSYQSLLTWNMVQCGENLITTLESRYFKGKEMKSADLVYLEKRKQSPQAFPPLPGDPVIAYLCP